MASRKPRTLPISTTPEFGEQSRSRLDALLALAMAYRRWTQRQLAHFLGRDVHNIVPGSGVPKLDVVIRLAEALGWPVALVLDGLRPQPSGYPTSEAGAGRSFDSLNRAAFWASVHGRHQEAIELAKAALGSAESGSQQAEADKRLSVAWDGLGDFTSAIECARRGLSRSGVGSLLRAELRCNLASAHLGIGDIHESEGVARGLLIELDRLDVIPRTRLMMLGHLRFVIGCCALYRLDLEPDQGSWLGQEARECFLESTDCWKAAIVEGAIAEYAARAHACRGGLLALDAVLSLQPTEAVLDAMAGELEPIVDLECAPRGDVLEGYCWWCLFGAHVAWRSRLPEDVAQRYLAIFTNKAYEIADVTGNWSFRARAFAYECLLDLDEPGSAGPTLDEDALRSLVCAMGRSSTAFARGMHLIESADWRRIDGRGAASASRRSGSAEMEPDVRSES